MSGWIGVDLDGTLAEYHGWVAPDRIGAPILRMVERVKYWLAEGKDVRIFTARAWPLGIERKGYTEFEWEELKKTALIAHDAIRRWCIEQFGKELPITCMKDCHMYELWDDRAVQVIPNTGIPLRNLSENKRLIHGAD